MKKQISLKMTMRKVIESNFEELTTDDFDKVVGGIAVGEPHPGGEMPNIYDYDWDSWSVKIDDIKIDDINIDSKDWFGGDKGDY